MKGLAWHVSTHRLRGVQSHALVFGLIVIGNLDLGGFQRTVAPRPLGQLEVLSGPVHCEGGECYEIRVTCPEVAAPARARLKVGAPAATTPRGTILFTSGGAGTSWYTVPSILTDVAAAGFRTVQLQWIDSWLLGSAGKEEGHLRLGCRPATVARWVYDHLFEQRPSAAFCATGHSGGAAQVSYLLSHYGLEGVLAAVVPSGGPPMARIDRSCTRDDPANATVAFPDWATRLIDAGFGFFPPGQPQSFNPFEAPAAGPCARGDASFREKFRQASVASGDGDYVYARTMVWFVLEGIDDTHAAAMGTTYHDLLIKMGSPLVRKTVVPDVKHAGPGGLYESPDGVRTVRDILLAECRPRTP
jgi:hypothetical protein